MNDTTNYCANCERLSEENAQLREALEGLLGAALLGARDDKHIALDYGELGLSLVRKARRILYARGCYCGGRIERPDAPVSEEADEE